jgi:sec-independent protein translocase protein TatA
MPGFIGLPELLLLGVVVLLLFGPKRLPEMGRSLGHGLREFKDSVTGTADADPKPARAELTAGADPIDSTVTDRCDEREPTSSTATTP